MSPNMIRCFIFYLFPSSNHYLLPPQKKIITNTKTKLKLNQSHQNRRTEEREENKLGVPKTEKY